MTTERAGMVLADRYRLDVPLASGGMGEVWRATDERLGREVAVKVLHQSLSERPGFLDRMRREARHAAMLSHAGIATVHDYGEHDGVGYLVMELVDGSTLAAMIDERQRLDATTVLDVLRQVTAALAVAHRLGLVHRDLKPANLMITPDGVVKLTDFGISSLTDSAAVTATGEVLGTPQYMAPEQLVGKRPTPASDVYALGTVAYEMLTGIPPFVADSPIAVARAQVHDLPAPLPPDLPADLRGVVMRCLAKAPEDRPADADSLLIELAMVVDPPCPKRAMSAAATQVLERDPTMLMPARAEPQLIESGARVRIRRRRRFVAGAVVLTVVGLLVLAASRSSESGVTGVTSSPGEASSTVAATVPPTATQPPPPAEVAPPAIVVDPAVYVGRDHKAVAEELRALGFVVEERPVKGNGAKKNTVVSVEPSGPLASGATVVIEVAKPGNG